MKYILLILILFSHSFSQYYDEDNSKRIISLKEKLKDLKNLRDRVITKRWKDRRQYYNDYEKFKQQYQEQKNTLENLHSKQQQQREALNTSIQKLEKTKSEYFFSLQKYQNLTIQQKNTLKNYLNLLNKRFPINITQRLTQSKRVLKKMDRSQSNPNVTLTAIQKFLQDEYNLTQTISLSFNQNLTLSDYTKGKGLIFHVGTIGSFYLDAKTNRTGVLLRNSNLEGNLFQWKESISPSIKNSLALNLSDLKENTKTLKTILIPIDILRNQISSNIYTEKNTKGFFGRILNYFQQGGIWMLPLLIVALCALFFISERFYYWWKYCHFSKRDKLILEKILNLTENKQNSEALKICQTHQKMVTIKPLQVLLENENLKNSEEIEQEVQGILLKEVYLLDKYLTTILVLSSTAPLIGLLGTVAGMISLFEIITLYGTSDPKLMAGGISLALITTQTGLAIAVPIILFHNYLSNRFEKVKQNLQHYTSKLLQTLYPHE